eukprot:gene5390-9203_t
MENLKPKEDESEVKKKLERGNEILKQRFSHYFCDIEEEYEQISQLGEGTYGKVFKSKNKKTGEIVAIKRIKMDKEKEGFPVTAIREITILKSLKHENIIDLKQVITKKDSMSFFMIFEFCKHDLSGLIDAKTTFENNEIKSIMKQLLNGILKCHLLNVIHRDIKSSNVLVTQDGNVKLADFGLSRIIQKTNEGKYTNRVITRWYRPPELLLGATNYDGAIDMWSIGCVFGELLENRPMFPGERELDQLDLIFSLCGTPTKDIWPDAFKLSGWNDISSDTKNKTPYKRVLKEKFKHHDPKAIDLLDKLLELDPKKRITAEQALNHDWFWTTDKPKNPSNLPITTCNELTAKNRRKREREMNNVPLSPQSKKLKNEQSHYHHQNQQRDKYHHRDDRRDYQYDRNKGQSSYRSGGGGGGSRDYRKYDDRGYHHHDRNYDRNHHDRNYDDRNNHHSTRNYDRNQQDREYKHFDKRRHDSDDGRY